MNPAVEMLIQLVVAVVVLIAILRQPYIGLALIVATQPVLGLIPSIPLLSSIVPLIGAITIGALLINSKIVTSPYPFKFSPSHLLIVLFIFWFFVTNPTAALTGSNRNWVFTYVQLFILFWLAGFLLDTPHKHRALMWLFAAATFVAAFFAIEQGGFFEEIDPLIRATGITQGANTAARYFVVSFVLFNYLQTTAGNIITRTAAFFGILITFLGVFYTVSRTGMLLLATAIILLVMLQSQFRYRVQVTLVALVAGIVLLLFSSSIFEFMQGIFPAITEGTDTVGLRYAVWEAGWEMWKDHPISGVGMGIFPYMLRFYPNPAYNFFFYKGLVAHNMYVSILAETGLIGFVLFMAVITTCLVSLITSRRKLPREAKQIANVWLIVLAVILLGGITKTDQVDKLLWLAMGTSVFFSNQAAAASVKPTVVINNNKFTKTKITNNAVAIDEK